MFFCIDKICFYVNKICSLHIMFTVFSKLLIIFKKSNFALIKIVHCFLIKIVHCFLHKLFLAFCTKLFSVQHYLKNCSFSFLRKLFSVHCLKNYSLFSHKTPSEIVFSKFKSQIWMLFHVFHNNRICFSALIKSVSTLIKFAFYTSCLLYIRIYLLHSYKLVFCIK